MFAAMRILLFCLLLLFCGMIHCSLFNPSDGVHNLFVPGLDARMDMEHTDLLPNILPRLNESQNGNIFLARHDLDVTERLLGDSTATSASSTLFANAYPFSSFLKLPGEDGISLFGSKIAFFSFESNQYAAVGEPGFDNFVGAVRVYQKPTDINTNSWRYVANIPSPVSDISSFGMEIVAQGGRVLIGAPAFDYHTGRLYLYQQVGFSVWELDSTILSPLPNGNHFGRSVALHGDYILAGSEGHHAFFYRRNSTSGGWTMVEDLVDPYSPIHGTVDNYFGSTVAMYEQHVAVSCYGDGGKVYMYEIVRGELMLTQEIRPVNATGLVLGFALSLQADRLAVSRVGTPITWDTSKLSFTGGSFPKGEVVVFDLVNVTNDAATLSVWQQSALIVSPVDGDFGFGRSVQLLGRDLAVGGALFPDLKGSAFTYSLKRNFTAQNLLDQNANVSLVSFPSNATSHTFQSGSVSNTFFLGQHPYYGPQNFSYLPYDEASKLAYWRMNQTFASPAADYECFGVSVGLTDGYIAVTADSYNDLQGAVFFGSVAPRATAAPSFAPTFRPTTQSPTSRPTSVPTAIPTAKPISNAGTANAGGVVTASSTVQGKAKTAIVIILVFAGLLVAFCLSMLLACCCLCRAAPLALDSKKKKKKKEEEDSPYVVYGPFDNNIHTAKEGALPDYGPGELIFPGQPYMPMPMPMPMAFYPYPQKLVGCKKWDKEKGKEVAMVAHETEMSKEKDKEKVGDDVLGDKPGAFSVTFTPGRAGFPRWEPQPSATGHAGLASSGAGPRTTAGLIQEARERARAALGDEGAAKFRVSGSSSSSGSGSSVDSAEKSAEKGSDDDGAAKARCSSGSSASSRPGAERVTGTRAAAAAAPPPSPPDAMSIIDHNLRALNGGAGGRYPDPTMPYGEYPMPAPYGEYPMAYPPQFLPMPAPWEVLMPAPFIDSEVFSRQEVNFVDPLFDPAYVNALLSGGVGAVPLPVLLPSTPRHAHGGAAPAPPHRPALRLDPRLRAIEVDAGASASRSFDAGSSSPQVAPRLAGTYPNHVPAPQFCVDPRLDPRLRAVEVDADPAAAKSRSFDEGASSPQVGKAAAARAPLASIEEGDDSEEGSYGSKPRPHASSVAVGPSSAQTPAAAAEDGNAGPSGDAGRWSRVLYEQRLRVEEARRAMQAVVVSRQASADAGPVDQPLSLPNAGSVDALDEVESGTPVHERRKSSGSSDASSEGRGPPTLVQQARDRSRALGELSRLKSIHRGKHTAPQVRDIPLLASVRRSAPERRVGPAASMHAEDFMDMDHGRALSDEDAAAPTPTPATPPAEGAPSAEESVPEEPAPRVASDRVQDIRARFDVYRQRALEREQALRRLSSANQAAAGPPAADQRGDPAPK